MLYQYLTDLLGHIVDLNASDGPKKGNLNASDGPKKGTLND